MKTANDPAPPVSNAPARDADARPAPLQPTESEGPEGPPIDKPWSEWVAESPMRQKMRSMWFASGLIVGNSFYPEISDLFLLRQSAENIAAKADAFADHWEAVRTNNRLAATAVNENDWQKVQEQLVETEQACESCHFENWSMATRGAMGATLEGWRDNDGVFGDEPWGQMRLNGAPQWIGQMLQLRARVRGAMFRARRLDKKFVLESTRIIHDFADDQARRWRLIEGQANAIARISRTGALWEVQGHYTSMRRHCMECHEKFAPDRGLDPMPWKG
jgi:cytochrome c556